MTRTQKIADRKIKASSRIAQLAADMAQHEHDRNYWRCELWPDGTVEISESIGQHEESVLPDNQCDPDNRNIQGAIVLRRVGTGSVDCNCDACRAGCVGPECCGDDDATLMEEHLLAAMDEVSDEYFSR